MNFAGRWKTWFIISLLIILPGLIVTGVVGLNLGIDFTGGNLLEFQTEENISSGDVRDVLRQFDLEQSVVQSSEENRFIVRMNVLSEGENEEIINAFKDEFGTFELMRNEKVGPVIGEELTQNGILALLIASVLIVIYITYRFELNFAIAAIIAVLHDVLITLAFMAFFQLQVDSAFVAAILTIIGYSINDTIVVFDRIRENLGTSKRREVEGLVNRSIRQTLVRSINTSGTTIVALLALAVFGGATTKILAVALVIGIASGTYSSIFIASPTWALLRTKRTTGKFDIQTERA